MERNFLTVALKKESDSDVVRPEGYAPFGAELGLARRGLARLFGVPDAALGSTISRDESTGHITFTNLRLAHNNDVVILEGGIAKPIDEVVEALSGIGIIVPPHFGMENGQMVEHRNPGYGKADRN